MAIYHLSANVISRARGQSVVAAAAYRSAANLRDERYGIVHRYAGGAAALHTEILAPADAPSWIHDRETLWNRVEAAERRRDSQLARVIEVGLPIELDAEQRVALLRDYIGAEFVAKGMVADFCVRDDSQNPLAHVLLTMRVVTASGFGRKERRWNGKANLLDWRVAWAERANEHLARAGHCVRIDHRTLAAQQIELTPGRRVGFGAGREVDQDLPDHLVDRAADQRRIARNNGELILEDPAVVLRALTHQRPTFTLPDLARFLRSRTADTTQYQAAYTAVTQSADCIAVAAPAGDEPRFTSQDMRDAAKSLTQRVLSMAARNGHGVDPELQSTLATQFSLDHAQRRALGYVMSGGDLKALALTAVANTAAWRAAARQAWISAGWQLMGATRCRAANECWEVGVGSFFQTLSAWEERWQQGCDLPTRETVLWVEGSEMIALRQLERVVAVADKARAKCVLFADSEQLQAMKIVSPFHAVLCSMASSDLTAPKEQPL